MESWHPAIHGVTKSRTRLSDWTELKESLSIQIFQCLERDDQGSGSASWSRMHTRRGNYIQYLVINHNGKEDEKECVSELFWCKPETNMTWYLNCISIKHFLKRIHMRSCHRLLSPTLPLFILKSQPLLGWLDSEQSHWALSTYFLYS